MVSKLDDIIQKTDQIAKGFSLQDIQSELALVNSDWRRIIEEDTWRYYKWIANLVKAVNPIQIVELGGQFGVSAIMMSSQMTQGQLLSVDCDADWRFVDDRHKRIVKVVSESVAFAETDKYDLSTTDIWFFDTTHWAEQLLLELRAHQKHFKLGAILLIDDIHMGGRDMEKAWELIPWERRELNELHYTGFGIVQINSLDIRL